MGIHDQTYPPAQQTNYPPSNANICQNLLTWFKILLTPLPFRWTRCQCPTYLRFMATGKAIRDNKWRKCLLTYSRVPSRKTCNSIVSASELLFFNRGLDQLELGSSTFKKRDTCQECKFFCSAFELGHRPDTPVVEPRGVSTHPDEGNLRRDCPCTATWNWSLLRPADKQAITKTLRIPAQCYWSWILCTAIEVNGSLDHQ